MDEPQTKPDYYEKPLTEESQLARREYESRLDALSEKYENSKGVARLKLQHQINRLNYMLDWQGANPKELDLDELKEVIHAPEHTDAVEDTYRARIKNQRTAIRAYCVGCMGGSTAAVKECPSVTCQLFPFRMGKDPLRGFALPKDEELALLESLVDEEDELSDDETDEDDEDDSDED